MRHAAAALPAVVDGHGIDRVGAIDIHILKKQAPHRAKPSSTTCNTGQVNTRDTETLRHSDTETQRHRDTQTQGAAASRSSE